jgi:hypothetical protein
VNTETRRGADDAAGGLGSRTMACGPREISRNSPAAVAVGNDGDMEALGRVRRGVRREDLPQDNGLHGHALSPPVRKQYKLLYGTK